MAVPILSKILIALRESKASDAQIATTGDEKDISNADVAAVNNGSEGSQLSGSENDEPFQDGVRAVEAVTLSWSKKTLALVFFKSVFSNMN